MNVCLKGSVSVASDAARYAWTRPVHNRIFSYRVSSGWEAFVLGLGQVLRIIPVKEELLHEERFDVWQAIGSDFRTVGDDLRQAMICFEMEPNAQTKRSPAAQ